MALRNPLPFSALLDEARGRGLPIGVAEYESVARLLSRWRGTDPIELRDAIAAVLASSQAEVVMIRELFDELFVEPADQPPALLRVSSEERSGPSWPTALGTADVRTRGDRAEADRIETDRAKGDRTEAARTSAARTPADRIERDGTAADRSEAAGKNAEPPARDARRILSRTIGLIGLGALAFALIVLAGWLLTTTAAPPAVPGGAPVGQDVQPQPFRLPIVDIDARGAGLVVLAIAIVLLVQLWILIRRPLLSSTGISAIAGLSGPSVHRFFLPSGVAPLASAASGVLASAFTSRLAGGHTGDELDVPETLRLSLRSAWPHLVFTPAGRRRSIMLLQDLGPGMDLWRTRCEALAASFAKRGVRIERWYFRGNPGLISRTPDAPSVPASSVNPRDGQSLIVLSAGMGLGGTSLDARADTFSLTRWPRRIWLNPIKRREYWPAELDRLAIDIWPLTETGLNAASRHLAGRSDGHETTPVQWGQAVTAADIDRLKRLIAIAPFPTMALAEQLRRRFAPDVPEEALLELRNQSTTTGRYLMLGAEEADRLLAAVRREEPQLEADVRRHLIALLHDSEPAAGSLAHRRWAVTLAAQRVALDQGPRSMLTTAEVRQLVDLPVGERFDELTSRSTFRPFRPNIAAPPEFSLKAVLAGVFFAAVFSASSVYLGLRAGVTVAASVPTAVLSMTILRRLGRVSVLEGAIVQTIASAGESVATGAMMIVPAFLLLTPYGPAEFSALRIALLAFAGGILGVLMIVPLRRALIVREHGVLPYPEGTACAEVLSASDQRDESSRTVFAGLGIGALWKAASWIFHLFATELSYSLPRTGVFPNATAGLDLSPEYVGAGYIIGPRIAFTMFAGSVFSWLVLLPLLSILGTYLDVTIFPQPGGLLIREMAPVQIWYSYARSIGLGALLMAGLLTLSRTLPGIVSSSREGLLALSASGRGLDRTDKDIPVLMVVGGTLAVGIALLVLPTALRGNILSTLLVLVFGFFFVTVSARVTGIIGSSSTPISGLTTAALLLTASIFLVLGWTGDAYAPVALAVGSVVCIASSTGAGLSQDLKTGFIVGSTPSRQQVGALIGVATSAIVAGLTIVFLHSALLIGSVNIPAPQSTLMATVLKGLLSFDLPWAFILMGTMVTFTIELCGVRSLPFAIGLCVPIVTTAPVAAGACVRWLIERRELADGELSAGTLFSSGLIAGGSLCGLVAAVIYRGDLGFFEALLGPGFTAVFFAGLLVILLRFAGGRMSAPRQTGTLMSK